MTLWPCNLDHYSGVCPRFIGGVTRHSLHYSGFLLHVLIPKGTYNPQNPTSAVSSMTIPKTNRIICRVDDIATTNDSTINTIPIIIRIILSAVPTLAFIFASFFNIKKKLNNYYFDIEISPFFYYFVNHFCILLNLTNAG